MQTDILQKNADQPDRTELLVRCRGLLQALLLFHLHQLETEAIVELIAFLELELPIYGGAD